MSITFAATRTARRVEVRYVGIGYLARIFEGGALRWARWRPTYQSAWFAAERRFNTKESIFNG